MGESVLTKQPHGYFGLPISGFGLTRSWARKDKLNEAVVTKQPLFD